MIGVLLMSFGTAATLDDVPAYLASVRGGKESPEDLVTEFKRRFARVGGSPLTRITLAQAAALESLLGEGFVVRVGMRHAPPFIADGLRELQEAGAKRVVAVILSPQYSDVIMGGYLRALDAAKGNLEPGVEVSVAGAWHDVDEFLDALAARVAAALTGIGRGTPVLLTAHSLPRSVANGEPGYIRQLQDTASWVAERAAIPPDGWTFAYQSAGHTREEWLTPDLKDLLPGLRDAGHDAVLVAPIQFLADHLEVLYDIDVAAREEAATLGIELSRPEMLNCDPGLIRALAAVVQRTLSQGERPLAIVK